MNKTPFSFAEGVGLVSDAIPDIVVPIYCIAIKFLPYYLRISLRTRSVTISKAFSSASGILLNNSSTSLN